MAAKRAAAGEDGPPAKQAKFGDGQIDPPHPRSVEEEVAVEESSFERVRRNKVACLGFLVRLAQRIERVWDAEGGDLRRALLTFYRSSLLSLSDHKDKDCSILAGLGEKMKNIDMDLRQFLTMALPVERQHTRGLRDDEFLVTRPDDLSAGGQTTSSSTSSRALPTAETDTDATQSPPCRAAGVVASNKEDDRLPLVLVCDNLRSAFNVGSLFRTAECLRVRKIYLCGYTATPEDAKGQTAKASMGAHDYVPWEHREKTLPVLEELRAAGYFVAALETAQNSVSLYEQSFPASPGTALLLGNERHGLEADLLAACSAVVRIPCKGVKNSLNVGIAAAICSYEVARQWS